MRDRYNTKHYIRERHPYRGKDQHQGLKWFLTALLTLILIGMITFTALLGAVIAGDHDEINGQPEAMIILGCQVKPWGPSILLQDRLNTALAYLREHPDLTVVTSGGQGKDEPTTEAAAMRDYLVENGIPAERILLEERSHNTIQNLRYSLAALDESGYQGDGVVVVSNGFHLARVRMLWDRTGYGALTLSTLAAPSSHLPSRVAMYIREPLALVKSFALDR